MLWSPLSFQHATRCWFGPEMTKFPSILWVYHWHIVHWTTQHLSAETQCDNSYKIQMVIHIFYRCKVQGLKNISLTKKNSAATYRDPFIFCQFVFLKSEQILILPNHVWLKNKLHLRYALQKMLCNRQPWGKFPDTGVRGSSLCSASGPRSSKNDTCLIIKM